MHDGRQWERVHGNPHIHKYKIHNVQFAQENEEFIERCERVGIEPTMRQASKYRNGKGLAFQKRKI